MRKPNFSTLRTRFSASNISTIKVAPSRLPWDSLDVNAFSLDQRYAIAYWFSLLSVFDSSGPAVFARAFIHTWETHEEDPVRKCFFSITRDYWGLETQEAMVGYLRSFQGIGEERVHGALTPFLFFTATLAVNIWIVSRGVAAGIERLARVAMPALFLLAVVLAIAVMTQPPGPAGDSPVQGLQFIYGPDFSRLTDASVWLASAGQIFFTLSVGMGSLAAYASYLSRRDDIVLNGLAARNELASPHGRLMTGVLLLQDLAIVALLLLVPILSGQTPLTAAPPAMGTTVELRVDWPYRGENGAPLNLLLFGRVVRKDRDSVAVQTIRHEFRPAQSPDGVSAKRQAAARRVEPAAVRP